MDDGKRRCQPERAAYHDRPDDPFHHGGHRAVVRPVGQDDLVDQHGEGGAHRIDQDSFPLEDGADLSFRSDVIEQGQHHRRAGDDEDRADQQRQLQLQIHDIIRAERGDNPGHQRPDRDQPDHDVTRVAQFADAQGQPTLEQDDADRDRDDRKQGLAQQMIGVDPAGHRPGEESAQQQEQNRWNLETPRHPLGANPQDDNCSQTGQRFFAHYRILKS